jgi:hypothetical protein
MFLAYFYILFNFWLVFAIVFGLVLCCFGFLKNQAPIVRLNAVLAVERTAAYSRTFAQL